MKPLPLFIDTSLLLLLVVGTASTAYIEKHKKLTEFTVEDYELLKKILSRAPAVLLTPNTLTESSNLAAYIASPAKEHIFNVLQAIIQNSQEHYIQSCTASNRLEFVRLGLTDAALIEASTERVAILTTDLDLYIAALSKGSTALNFNHLRDKYM